MGEFETVESFIWLAVGKQKHYERWWVKDNVGVAFGLRPPYKIPTIEIFIIFFKKNFLLLRDFLLRTLRCYQTPN